MADGNRIFGRRAARRQAEIEAAIAKGIEDGVEKAITPAVAMASQMSSGATYPVFTQGNDSPFNQVGPGQGFQPLPRPRGLFDSGFGPANPLFPDAIDPLLPNGRTQPRRTEYLIAANVNLVDRRVPWSVLKGLAEDVDVIQRCIQIVQDAIVGLEWEWTFSPQIIQQIMLEENITNSSKASAIARQKYGDELARVQSFFDYPDRRMGFTFSQWLTDIIYSHLVYDGIVISPEYNLKGELTSLSTIDTSTIKILLDNQGFIPRPPAPAYQQILYGFPRGEFQAENVQQDGKIPDAYTSDQLAYYIRRPRPNSVYGYSQVEECINIATIYMERQAWLHAEYTSGVTPKMAVTVDGTETWTPEQLAYYERIYNDQFSGQTARRQQFMLFRPGMKPEQLKTIDEAYKNTYDEWLVAQIGAKFGIPQASLGIPGKSQLGGGGAHKEQGDQYKEYSTDALRNFLIESINDLARRFLGVGRELTISATGGGNDQDNLQRAQADASDVNAGLRTRNEIRAERGMPLMTEPEADELGVLTGSGVTFLAGTLAQQKAQQGGASNGGAATQPTGTSADAPDANEPARPADTGGDGGTDSAGNTKGESTADVTAKDDERQPEAADSTGDDVKQPEAAKQELASFLRFAKARAKAGSWRTFEFDYVGKGLAEILNAVGEVGNLELLRHTLAKAGDPQGLIDWYNAGADGQIDWGNPGDFDDCVAVASQYMDDDQAKGFCNLRHQDAVGGAPGSEDTQKAASDTFTPPQGVRAEARRALEWLKDGEAGDGFTSVGRKRASDLAAGHAISLDTIKRMSSYLARHEVDKQGKGWSPGEEGYPSPGRVAWAAWGGDPAVSWTNGILRSAQKSAADDIGDTAFLSPTGYVRLPAPLKAGDKIVVEHADKTSNDYTLEDPDDVAPELDHDASVIADDEELEAADAVTKMLEPELRRLRDAYGLLERVRARTSQE